MGSLPPDPDDPSATGEEIAATPTARAFREAARTIASPAWTAAAQAIAAPEAQQAAVTFARAVRALQVDVLPPETPAALPSDAPAAPTVASVRQVGIIPPDHRIGSDGRGEAETSTTRTESDGKTYPAPVPRPADDAEAPAADGASPDGADVYSPGIKPDGRPQPPAAPPAKPAPANPPPEAVGADPPEVTPALRAKPRAGRQRHRILGLSAADSEARIQRVATLWKTMSTREIAAELDAAESTIRRWKGWAKEDGYS